LKPSSAFWRFALWSAAVGLPLAATALDRDLARFVTTKETQARKFAESQTNKVPSITWSFFDAVRVDDWETATNLAARLHHASGRYLGFRPDSVSASLQTPIWQTISETLGAYELFHDWDNKWLHRFGREIIESIPKGSIYFGGTDPGRFVISALSESHVEGRPFFTVTQNQLADSTYLDYLRQMYGGKIAIPTVEDSQSAFNEYVTNAQERLKAGRLKPGENVRMVDGRVQVSGQVAVMEINGLIARILVEKNPDRQFYVEESFPLDWMYPHLSPHGLILELHRKPLSGLREADVQKSHDYWKQLVGELIGDWITDKTSVREICSFCQKVYLQKDLSGFKGDAAFAGNKEAQKTFSKLRSSIGGLYAWRAGLARDHDEKDRMTGSAELAYKQALALCPYSPEAVFRYCNLLVSERRTGDAILIAETCIRLEPENELVRDLVKSLRKAE
jgi:hypothetical protein